MLRNIQQSARQQWNKFYLICVHKNYFSFCIFLYFILFESRMSIATHLIYLMIFLEAFKVVNYSFKQKKNYYYYYYCVCEMVRQGKWAICKNILIVMLIFHEIPCVVDDPWKLQKQNFNCNIGSSIIARFNWNQLVT